MNTSYSYLVPIFAGTLLFVSAILLLIGDNFMKDIKTLLWLFGIFCVAIGIHIGMALDDDSDNYIENDMYKIFRTNSI